VREAKKTFTNDHLEHCLDHIVDAVCPYLPFPRGSPNGWLNQPVADE
jgi:hypothetical protein